MVDEYIRSLQTPDLLPSNWYNILPDLPEPIPPMKLGTGEVVRPEMLEKLFTRTAVKQEFSMERYISIPSDLRETYLEIGRPTPLPRAKRLEEYLNTPAKIYY
ncbi:hypothetical protein [Staphylothermus hellenicus]|uniref:hypothetical protein n=1 Tax=Staphylothermus hellenicus TaxID=84599 RepID=UPI0001C4458B|nr:hypothetical protein [Staphylothermus hellenicus]